MSLQAINTYLAARLKEVDSSFKEHEDISNENVGAGKFDRRFNFLISEMNCSPPSSLITTDTASVEATLFFDGFRDPKKKTIDGFDVANKFRLKAMNPGSIANDSLIKTVVCTRIRPDQGDGNDNIIKMKVLFDITLSFSTIE